MDSEKILDIASPLLYHNYLEFSKTALKRPRTFKYSFAIHPDEGQINDVLHHSQIRTRAGFAVGMAVGQEKVKS